MALKEPAEPHQERLDFLPDLIAARAGARVARVWCWSGEDVALAVGAGLMACIGPAAFEWRVEVITSGQARRAEDPPWLIRTDRDPSRGLAFLGCIDAAICGKELAQLAPEARASWIDALSRVIATDGYLALTPELHGERLRDRFVAQRPGLYRPVALTLDLSFLSSNLTGDENRIVGI